MSILATGNQKEYFTLLMRDPCIPGSHDSAKELRGELGYLLKKLKDSDHNNSIKELVAEIHTVLKIEYSIEEFQQEYYTYLLLLIEREDRITIGKLDPVDVLEKSKWNHWGSLKQLNFGRCVVDALNSQLGHKLHPVWGCLLSPTGGITGPGSKELLSKHWDSFVSLHSCVHDAAGYLYNYHNLGPGFNYLRTWWTVFPTFSPYSCQYAGLRFWKKFVKNQWKNFI